jgi:predicted phosphate transport protein (TIGR00153 family)
MARFRLIPREERFYDEFVAVGEELRRGAQLLIDMLAPEHPVWDKADEIKEVEHKCDFLTHDIVQRLNRTFVTPIDREDIHELASSVDNVMDAIDHCAAVVRLYRIDRVRGDARDLARIIAASVEQLHTALKALEGREGVFDAVREINRLENEGDRAHQRALGSLFEAERDAIAVIKWKEILDFLEGAIDRCRDAANVLEGIVVKHG